MKRYILFLLVALSFVASTAQMLEEFHIIQSDGSFSSFLCSEIKSIQLSKTDITGTGTVSEKYVTQIVEKSDGSSYQVPISEMKEMSFDTPPIEQSTYIDLGLSVKWASCNAGASSPEGYGGYYNWKAACKFNLPTKAQMAELVDKCTWEGTTLNGVKGVKVTGPNGNSIFMPCAGYHYKSSSNIYSQGNYVHYWSSTPNPDHDGEAYFLKVGSGGFRSVYDYGHVGSGFSVRPVVDTPPIETYIDLGLSVKWASCNVGASSPEGYGEYYNWKAACKFNLPTKAQMEELINKCTWENTTLNGVTVMKVTGSNGNSIFMPSTDTVGYDSIYWSSTPESDRWAYSLLVGEPGCYMDYNRMDKEYFVRAVSEK